MHAEVSALTPREEVLGVWNDQLRIHVKVAGTGPPLLFLHGGGGLRWTPFLERLSGRFTVYAPELPGTSAADPHAIHKVDTFADLLLMYEELVHGLSIEGAVAIGESLGGMIVADLAAHFPTLFSKLVLLAPAGLWREDHPPHVVEAFSSAPERAPEYLFFDHQGELAQAYFAPPEDPELIPSVVAAIVWAQGCAAKFLWPIPDQGLAKRLHRVTAPTLIIFGAEDRLMPSIYGQEFAARIAGSRAELIDHCGHIPHVEALDRTWELISEFLR